MQCAVYLRQGGYKPQRGDHQLCHWGLQSHQSGERHQHRGAELVSCTDLARQIRCVGFPARMGAPSYSRSTDNRKSTLVFCVNLSHVRELTQTFRDAGIDARHVHSKTSAAERRLLIEDFKAGKYPVLVNCGSLSLTPVASANLMSSDGSAILTEGADIPNIDCVIVARPTRSRNVMAQMVRSSFVSKLAPIDLVRRLDAG